MSTKLLWEDGTVSGCNIIFPSARKSASKRNWSKLDWLVTNQLQKFQIVKTALMIKDFQGLSRKCGHPVLRTDNDSH